MSLTSAICPLWTFDELGWPVYLGSSTLICFGDAFFLVSCAHVFDNAQDQPIYFIAKQKPTLLSGAGRITNPPATGGRKADKADNFFFMLSPESAEAMRREYHFATADEIAVGDSAISTNYTFTGYPENMTRPRGRHLVRAEGRLFTAGAMQPDDFKTIGLSDITHVGVRLKGATLMDQHGRKTNMPKLNGISGGPVLMHYYESCLDPQIRPRLVGLCMENPEEAPEFLVGVRMSAILESIRDRHPELDSLIPKDTRLEIVLKRSQTDHGS